MLKWVYSFEGEAENKLLTNLEIESGYEIKFNLKSLLASDKKTEIDLLLQQVDRQLLTKNEFRAIQDMPPLPDGDVFYQAPNTSAAQLTKQPAAAADPVADTAAADPTEDTADRQLKRLLAYEIDRLKKRIAKSGKPAEQHRSIIEETLQPVFRHEAAIAADYLIEFYELETSQQIEELKQWS